MEPVNPEDLALPDYFDIIKHPMDLGSATDPRLWRLDARHQTLDHNTPLS